MTAPQGMQSGETAEHGTGRIALIGDHDARVTAHRAIPLALELAGRESGAGLTWDWIHTTSIGSDVGARLAGYTAVWCVPASPYANAAGALAAIRHARERRIPFLGTCGGFQHAMLEYAEACWGVTHAAHAETEPGAPDPVIAPLACGLVEVTDTVRLVPGSRLRSIYGCDEVSEGYHCRYGLGERYASRLTGGPLHVAARDAAGEIRAVELQGHPFYFATLYQPERSAFTGRPHPLIAALVAAASLAIR
jgi:CTP synthase (UTP-ammonia lyase)